MSQKFAIAAVASIDQQLQATGAKDQTRESIESQQPTTTEEALDGYLAEMQRLRKEEAEAFTAWVDEEMHQEHLATQRWVLEQDYLFDTGMYFDEDPQAGLYWLNKELEKEAEGSLRREAILGYIEVATYDLLEREALGEQRVRDTNPAGEIPLPPPSPF